MMSYLRFLTIKTFRKWNPDWEIRFYHPKTVYTGGKVWNQGFAESVTGIDYKNRISEIENVKIIEIDFDKSEIGHIPDVFRSDILRLKWLGSEGGLWSDMDIIYFRPMDEMCFNTPHNQEIDTVISYNTVRTHYSIGFLIGCRCNGFYSYLYNHALNHKKQDGEYQHLGITLWHKCFPLPEHIRNAFPNLTIYDIQMWLTYSINSFEIRKILQENVQLPDSRTIGLHWYGGHPDCVKWESTVTEDNYHLFNNTLTSTIKRALA